MNKKIKLKFLSDSLIFFILGLIIGAGLILVYDNSVKVPDLSAAASYLKFKEVKVAVTPTGVPAVYGKELNLSFDRVQESINIMVPYGPTYGQEGKRIILTGEKLERYKKIGLMISCEYCCGVAALTREDGVAACGCAHSIMMRGLAAYLLENYPQQFTDEEILNELVKWKATFFPKQTITKELQQLQQAGEPGIQEILEEFPEFMTDMVGGC